MAMAAKYEEAVTNAKEVFQEWIEDRKAMGRQIPALKREGALRLTGGSHSVRLRRRV